MELNGIFDWEVERLNIKTGPRDNLIGSNEETYYVDDGIVEFKNNCLSILTSNIFDIKNSDKLKIEDMIKEAESHLRDEKIDDQKRFIISQKVEVLKSLN